MAGARRRKRGINRRRERESMCFLLKGEWDVHEERRFVGVIITEAREGIGPSYLSGSGWVRSAGWKGVSGRGSH